MKRNCIIGSATNLSFTDKLFDVVYSTDTLEHLKPEDVHVCVDEMYRVSKRYLVVQVGTTLEKRKGKYNWVKKARLVGIKHLHLSPFKKEVWRDIFEKKGWKLLWEGLEGTKTISFIFSKRERDQCER